MGYAKTNLTTVKRKANAGERILITDNKLEKGWAKFSHNSERYRNGDVLTVIRSDSESSVRARTSAGDYVYVSNKEYEVIVVEASAEPTPINATLTAAHAAIDELRRKAYAEGFDAGRAFEKGESREQFGEGMDENKFEELRGKLKGRLSKETPQEIRDKTVEQAKADVVELINDYQLSADETEFIVNKEKRTVVVLMKHIFSGKLLAKGIAKCAPDDCFNVHIGKAISLRRALGLEVPAEYLNAPQPETVRVGDVVRLLNIRRIVEVSTDGQSERLTQQVAHGDSKIIDDSREVSE